MANLAQILLMQQCPTKVINKTDTSKLVLFNKFIDQILFYSIKFLKIFFCLLSFFNKLI